MHKEADNSKVPSTNCSSNVSKNSSFKTIDKLQSCKSIIVKNISTQPLNKKINGNIFNKFHSLKLIQMTS